MPEHVCPRCGYETNKRSNLKNHIFRKNQCDPNIDEISIDDLRKDFYVKTDTKRYSCKCGKQYSSLGGYLYHKNICEQNNIDTKKSDDHSSTIDTLNNKIQELELQVQFLQNTKKERFYQKVVESYLNGTHVKVACGFTDVTNETTHAEIKVWDDWKASISQLLCYNDDMPKTHLHAYMFGKEPCQKRQDFICEKLKKFNIDMYIFSTEESCVNIIKYDTKDIVYTFTM